MRFFERIQVLALNVLDQGHHGGGRVGHHLVQHRHRIQARQLGGAKTPLAGDDFVLTGAERPHEDRLHHPLALDALGQFIERAFIHPRARLVLAGVQTIQRQRVRHALGQGGFGHLGAEQGFEAEAQTFGFLGDHRLIVSE